MSKAKKYVPFILAGVATPVLYTLGKKLFGMDTPNMPTLLRLSDRGRKHLIDVEGWRDKAYTDSAGKATIGVGHLIKPGESNLLHATLSTAQINKLLDGDILIAEGIVRRAIKVPIKQGLFDALVSIAFNTGKIPDKIATAINSNNIASLANIWVNSYVTVNNGKTRVAGLVTRRQKEVNLFA